MIAGVAANLLLLKWRISILVVTFGGHWWVKGGCCLNYGWALFLLSCSLRLSYCFDWRAAISLTWTEFRCIISWFNFTAQISLSTLTVTLFLYSLLKYSDTQWKQSHSPLTPKNPMRDFRNPGRTSPLSLLVDWKLLLKYLRWDQVWLKFHHHPVPRPGQQTTNGDIHEDLWFCGLSL